MVPSQNTGALPTLQINLLGSFSARLNDAALGGFRSAKARGLLAYLASQPDQPHARATLATLFWGDLPETAARANLRVELSGLRAALAEHPALLIERAAVRFDSRLANVDTVHFRQRVDIFLARAADAQRAHLAQLTDALALYRGEFLVGLHIDAVDGFDEWRLLMQEQLHQRALIALDLVQGHFAALGEWAALGAAARQQLTLSPWLESAHRRLMQSLAAQGHISAALDQYAICRETLRAELGLEPALETQQLAQRLREDRVDPPARRHNLAQSSKTLIGRQAELDQLCALLRVERLVTVLGIGGVGKTHLASAAAQRLLDDFPDGVWSVALSGIDAAGGAAANRVALAIAAAIGHPMTDARAPLYELSSVLTGKRLLLLLDNLEHFTGTAGAVTAADAVLDVLLACAGVRVLATSRVRLNVPGEAVLTVHGLGAQDARALFVTRMRQAVTLADASGVFERDIDRLCAQVAGLPLAIELAAGWVEHFPVEEIGRSIAGIRAEPGHASEHAERHQHLTSVFEHAWRLLSAREQATLAQVSVFRGGFDRAAALALADGGLGELTALIGQSLVQRVAAGRYDVHPLVRELADAHLSIDGRLRATTRHSQHYLDLLCAAGVDTAALAQRDFDNVRLAWRRAVQAGDASLIARAVAPFAVFIQHHGSPADGAALFREATERFASMAGRDDVLAALVREQLAFDRALRDAGLGLAAVTLDGDHSPVSGHGLGTGGMQQHSLRESLARHVSDDALFDALFAFFERRVIAAGEYLIRQAEPANAIYFVESGQMTAQLEPPGKAPLRLETMGAGHVIGELGFFSGSSAPLRWLRMRRAWCIRSQPTAWHAWSTTRQPSRRCFTA